MDELEKLRQQNKAYRVLLGTTLDQIDNMIDKCNSTSAWALEMKQCLERDLQRIKYGEGTDGNGTADQG